MPAIHVRLTDLQRDLILEIHQYQRSRGFCPTVRELKNSTGASSTSVVHYNLNHLQALGLVTWEPFIARTIRINETVLPPLGARTLLKKIGKVK